jgi:hypothetical protein
MCITCIPNSGHILWYQMDDSSGALLFDKWPPRAWCDHLCQDDKMKMLPSKARKVIPIMDLVQELKDKGVPVGGTQPKVKCKMFEDNSAALTLANAPAMRPRTKHINVKYHFFRCHVYSPLNPSGWIKIMACKSEDNIADILTKPVDLVTLLRLRYRAMGW